MRKAMHADGERRRCPTWMVLFWGAFMLPPSCLRAVDSLRFTSFFGMCAMVYLPGAQPWSNVFQQQSSATLPSGRP